MRYVKNMEALEVKYVNAPEAASELWSFSRWVMDAVLTDAKFGKGLKPIMMAVDIRTKVDRTTVGDYIEFSDAEYDAIFDVLENPTAGFHPFIAIQTAPFFKAVAEAAKEHPDRQ